MWKLLVDLWTMCIGKKQLFNSMKLSKRAKRGRGSVLTFSGGRSIPKFPRDIMMPSASWRISSKWFRPYVIGWVQVMHNQTNKYSTKSLLGQVILGQADHLWRKGGEVTQLVTSTFSILAKIWVWWSPPNLDRNSRACRKTSATKVAWY